LHHFQFDIEQAVEKGLGVYAETKLKLEKALDHAHADLDVAEAALASLQQQLVIARLKLTEEDNDQNRGEVRCCEFGIKCGAERVSAYKQNSNKAILDWRVHMNLFKEKCKAQCIIENHFKQKEQKDREGWWLSFGLGLRH
jgi:hypothetical protein